ncbi:DUF3592 domain-containing protein [Luteolibacter yonseiensis]|uniref:DUF3592 domain-containing protein n=1 Tax=Luteolibacter yonseiensis TaxID=1144680 RepID=A0A934V9H0_9BACT|nr:DUF3592 domain-containing protein [Luteolibacter yonseiensis]MBK1818332.1 DUF3592 domain-containing protein [Luteolibacter yonseiensis]
MSTPRTVPQEILREIVPPKVILVKCVAGCGLLLFGLLLGFLFIPRHLPQQRLLDRGPVEFVEGRIVTAEKTGAKENEIPIWKYGFIYQPPGHAGQKGTAYAAGGSWSVGSVVKILHLPDDPRIAAPVGARLDESPAWTVVVLVFPLLGLYCIVHTLSDLRWKKRLLSEGLIGKAVVDSVEKSRFHSEGQDEYVLRMTRVEDGTRIQKRIRTNAEIHVATAKLKSGEPLTLLYCRDKPQRFLIVESWGADAGAALPMEPFSAEQPMSSAAAAVRPVGGDETSSFLEMPLPRRIPKGIRSKVTRSYQMPIAFGFMGLLVALASAWAFFPFHLARQWRLDAGPSKVVPGRILSVEDSRTEILSVRVKEHHFSYRPEGGGEKQGIAYTTGGNWQVGTPLQVRYLIAHPELAVPEGARLGETSTVWALVLIFPLGMGVFFFGLVFLRMRDLEILRFGVLSTARITSVEKMSVGVHDQHRIYLVRSDDGATMVKRSHEEHEIAFAKWKQDAGEPVRILHRPHKLKRFLLPEIWN